MDLYLVRHGETHWNRELRLQGQNDSPLTLAGIEQALAFARQLQRTFAGAPRPRLLCSPLGRALQTAAIIAEHLEIPFNAIEREPLIAERHHGEFDGLTREEIDLRMRPANAIFRDVRLAAPGGETMMDVHRRMTDFLAKVPRGEPVVVVCHGTVSRVMRAVYLGVPAEAMHGLERHTQDRFYRMTTGDIQPVVCAAVRVGYEKPTA